MALRVRADLVAGAASAARWPCRSGHRSARCRRRRPRSERARRAAGARVPSAGSRCPMCRLSAVGSNPAYAVIDSRTSQSSARRTWSGAAGLALAVRKRSQRRAASRWLQGYGGAHGRSVARRVARSRRSTRCLRIAPLAVDVQPRVARGSARSASGSAWRSGMPDGSGPPGSGARRQHRRRTGDRAWHRQHSLRRMSLEERRAGLDSAGRSRIYCPRCRNKPSRKKSVDFSPRRRLSSPSASRHARGVRRVSAL